MQDFPLFPDAASSLARDVDYLYFAWAGISVFFATLIALLIVVFFVKYRQKAPQSVGKELEMSTLPLEIGWSILPLVITLAMFTWGAKVFFDLSRPPADAVDYFASAKQWMWKFQHPEGIRETNDLHVPVGQAVRMTMTSQDVIHSLYLPAFRVKADVVPGRYTTVWFRADKPGSYHLFCAEYCGTEHSKMGGTIHVLEEEDYDQWIESQRLGNPVRASGRRLFEQLACDTCHREGSDSMADLGPERAPRLAGLLGREVTLHDGSRVTADETYVRESILNPQEKIVAGWQPIMPTYRGQVTEEQVLDLITYIKTLETPTETSPDTPGESAETPTEVARIDAASEEGEIR